MYEWFKVSGLGIFIVGAIVVIDRYKGITGNVISENLGAGGSLIGVVLVLIGLGLFIAGFRKK